MPRTSCGRRCPNAYRIEQGGNGNGHMPTISELVHEGQEIVVQVVKDPIGTKGARLSTHLSIPSRYLVLLPHARTLGISTRIEDEAERQRLKDVLTPLIGENPLGYIVRTNAEGQSAESLAFDVTYLGKVWRVVQENIAKAKVGERVYEELSLPLRALRDLLNDDIEKVRVDSRETFEKVAKFVHKFMPSLDDRIEHYAGERPIFDLYGVEDEIQRALRKEVPLKSGGYLIVDQTEAMTTIDVNTGGYLGTRNLEETVYRTNLEAAQAASRQLRLRNLGGIIIIDFIDMTDEEHKRQVIRMLEKGLTRDHAKTTVYPMSQLGLGRDDAQAHHRKPGAPIVRTVSGVHGTRHGENGRDGHVRNLPRNHAGGPSVQCAKTFSDGQPKSGKSHPRRRVHGGRRTGRVHLQKHTLPT
jgi:ribonuclease G